MFSFFSILDSVFSVGVNDLRVSGPLCLCVCTPGCVCVGVSVVICPIHPLGQRQIMASYSLYFDSQEVGIAKRLIVLYEYIIDSGRQ